MTKKGQTIKRILLPVREGEKRPQKQNQEERRSRHPRQPPSEGQRKTLPPPRILLIINHPISLQKTHHLRGIRTTLIPREIKEEDPTPVSQVRNPMRRTPEKAIPLHNPAGVEEKRLRKSDSEKSNTKETDTQEAKI